MRSWFQSCRTRDRSSVTRRPRITTLRTSHVADHGPRLAVERCRLSAGRQRRGRRRRTARCRARRRRPDRRSRAGRRPTRAAAGTARPATRPAGPASAARCASCSGSGRPSSVPGSSAIRPIAVRSAWAAMLAASRAENPPSRRICSAVSVSSSPSGQASTRWKASGNSAGWRRSPASRPTISSRSRSSQGAVGSRGSVEAGEDPVTHRGEQLVLVLDVPVQRHRGDPELLAEPADAHRVEALGIGDRDGPVDDRVAAELVPFARFWPSQLDNYTP